MCKYIDTDKYVFLHASALARHNSCKCAFAPFLPLHAPLAISNTAANPIMPCACDYRSFRGGCAGAAPADGP